MNEQGPATTVGLALGKTCFTTTHWSVVLRAGRKDSPQAAAALDQLCQTYWYPLYAFARRSGLTQHDAQDATQSFFSRLLANCLVARANPQRGRFRTFLLTSFKNHLGQARLKAAAQKRGGGVEVFSLDETVAEERYRREPADRQTPDRLFERRWAITLIEKTLEGLEREYSAAGKTAEFVAMEPYLTGDCGPATGRDLGQALGVREGTARVALHRLRDRYAELFRAEVGQTVTTPEGFEAELRRIREILSE